MAGPEKQHAEGNDPPKPKNGPAQTYDPANATAATAGTDFHVCLSFYDHATLKSMEPPEELISFYRSGDKESKISHRWEGTKKGHYVLQDIQHPTLVEVILNGDFERNCDRYVSAVVAFMAAGPNSKEVCMVHAPLFKLEGSCRVTFHAYDWSDEADSCAKETQLTGVRVVLTPVHAPRGQNEPPSSMFARSYTAETIKGIAEINGVPHRQLFQLEVQGPQGYICRNVPEFIQTCCDSLISIDLGFESCERLSAPTLVFVREGCPAARYSGLTFEAAGSSHVADQNGIWTAPADLAGEISLSHPQRSFFPSHFELDNKTSPVILVTVSESTQRSLQYVRARHVDEDDIPFAHRTLKVLLPDGNRIEVMTDAYGWFEVPHGSQVYAVDDDLGSHTEAVLVTTTNRME